MSVDVERISPGIRHICEVLASLIDITIALCLLERQLGLAAVAFASLFIDKRHQYVRGSAAHY